MSILSGYTRYKRHILTSGGYKLCSQWTSSNSVVMGDGTDDTNTLETNLGSIKGITDSLTATSSNIALSASAGNNLQTQVDTLNSNFSKANQGVGAISSSGIQEDRLLFLQEHFHLFHFQSIEKIQIQMYLHQQMD